MARFHGLNFECFLDLPLFIGLEGCLHCSGTVCKNPFLIFLISELTEYSLSYIRYFTMYSPKEKSRSLTCLQAHIAMDTLHSLLLDIAKIHIIWRKLEIGKICFISILYF